MTSRADPSSDFADRPWMAGAQGPRPARPARVQVPDRGWLIACHLAPIALWIFYPYGAAILFPLLVWQLKAKPAGNERLTAHAIESLNYQINVTLLSLALMISVIGIVLLPILMVAAPLLAIIAGIKTAKGEDYRYPWIYRLIKDEGTAGVA